MPRPRFSEMLVERRRQLGLSIAQASKVLRLKEQALIAFEEGDFENMPQSGYAQGMLSSYARYLGLNPREVVDLFQEESYEFENGTYSHELRRRTRDTQSGRGIAGYDLVNESGSRPKAYVQYHGLLPTAGGPAGDMGAFATTSGVRFRQNSVPLAGQASNEDAGGYSYSQYATGHAYNAGIEGASRQKNIASRTRSGVQRKRVGVAGVNIPAYRDDVTKRPVTPSDYTDDLRYDSVAAPYERASTISGRRNSRNIAQVNRPNVRRRQPTNASAQKKRVPQRSGIIGALQNYFSDTRRTIATVFVLVVIIISAVLVYSVRSCMSARTTPAPTKTVSVNNSSSDSSKNSSTKSTDSSTTKTDDASKKSTTETKKTEEAPKQTTVAVTVADGQTSWVEITVDGKSVEADAITGPWSQTYTVTDSMTVLAGTPGAVSVSINGTNKPFDANSSGIGTMTIQGTKPTDANGSSTNAESSSSGSSTSETGTSGTTSSNTSASTSNNTQNSTSTNNSGH